MSMFDGLNFVDAAFILLSLLTALYVLRAQRKRPEIDLIDILTGDNGRISQKKVGLAIAAYVAAWIMVRMTMAGNMTAEVFAIYLTAFAGLSLGSEFIKSKDTSVTSVTHTSTQTTAPAAVVVPVVAPVAADALAPKAAATVDQEALEIEAAAQRIQEATK